MSKYDQSVNDFKTKLKVDTLDENATLASFGLDSLDVVEFILEIEDNYGLSFEASEAQGLETLGSLLNLIKSKCE